MINTKNIVKTALYLTVGSVFVFSFLGCSEAPIEPEVEAYFTSPSHFPARLYDNPANELSAEKVALGKALFFDPILSVDSTISCGSCHQIEYAMSDRNRKFSIGVDGQLGTRNSPALFNLAWQEDFMWDGGVNHLEFVPLAPIENHIEMNLDFVEAMDRLNNSKYYRTEFKRIFDVDHISDREFLYAMAQFMAVMVSAESKYDDMVLGKSKFSMDEQKGYELFKTNCAECHAEPLFTSTTFKNNGLDSTITDEGRKRTTTYEEDLGKFKVPSLRNLAYTAPYMHDGKLKTLEEVLDHYSDGIQSNSQSPPDIENLNLSELEKQQIISFLHTLNDEKFVTNELFVP